jgi:predicted AAA+ superfamily ATPase
MLNYNDLSDEDLSKIVYFKNHIVFTLSQLLSQTVNFKFEEVRLYPNIKNELIQRAGKNKEIQNEFKRWIRFLDEVDNVDGVIWIRNVVGTNDCIVDITFN